MFEKALFNASINPIDNAVSLAAEDDDDERPFLRMTGFEVVVNAVAKELLLLLDVKVEPIMHTMTTTTAGTTTTVLLLRRTVR